MNAKSEIILLPSFPFSPPPYFAFCYGKEDSFGGTQTLDSYQIMYIY